MCKINTEKTCIQFRYFTLVKNFNPYKNKAIVAYFTAGTIGFFYFAFLPFATKCRGPPIK